MACEVLQIDDIAPAFASGSKRRDSQRMHNHGRIKPGLPDVSLDQVLDSPNR
jgi:hypothetical protein